MGAVAMKSNTIGRDRGYPIVEATLYIYCDTCGSFNIETYVPFEKVMIIATVLTAVILARLYATEWLPCFIPIGIFALFLPWKDILLHYKCRNCGNTQISDYNVLHYQSYDTSVIDVPDQWTQKRYIDEDVTNFRQFT